MGVVLKDQGSLEESIQAYQQAIHVQPDYAEAYSNLGNVLREQGKLEESIEAYQQAIQIQPGSAETHNNLGLILLLLGDFYQGWKEYEWRLKCSNFSSENRNFPQPYWNGIHLNGKSVLIWAEKVAEKVLVMKLCLPVFFQL